MPKSIIYFLLLTSFVMPNAICAVVSPEAEKTKPVVTIVIDDLGYQTRDFGFLDLPSEITFAILPNAQFSTVLAQRAHAQDRDVILHMPMEPLEHSRELGKAPLMSNMDRQQLAYTFKNALASVPFAIGMNNHMGSKFTQLSGPLQGVMDFLKDTGMFFLDSRTTPFSKAYEIAKSANITALRRDVFLDHQKTPEFMQIQLKRLIIKAKQNGQALAIAHPHQSTLVFLREILPTLHNAGVELVDIQTYQNRKIPQI